MPWLFFLNFLDDILDFGVKFLGVLQKRMEFLSVTFENILLET